MMDRQLHLNNMACPCRHILRKGIVFKIDAHILKPVDRLTGFPVKAGNDATVAAMGECWKGGGQGCKNMVFATLGTGVGGGIVVDGKVILGAHGAAGEIGHMVLNRNETATCGCGKRGCAEQYCSATGIVRLAKKYLAATETPSALRAFKNLTCKDVFDLAQAGDTEAVDVLETVFDLLGEAIASACCIIDPDRVILGGGVSKAGETLLDFVRPAFVKYAFTPCSHAKFVLAELGNDAGICGAARLILDN